MPFHEPVYGLMLMSVILCGCNIIKAERLMIVDNDHQHISHQHINWTDANAAPSAITLVTSLWQEDQTSPFSSLPRRQVSDYSGNIDRFTPPNHASSFTAIASIDAALEPRAFIAQTELYCLGALCNDIFFSGDASVLFDPSKNIVVIEQLNANNPLGTAIHGNIVFNYQEGEVSRGVAHDLMLITADNQFNITGESVANFMLPQPNKLGFAELQIRDHDLSVVLDVQMQITSLN